MQNTQKTKGITGVPALLLGGLLLGFLTSGSLAQSFHLQAPDGSLKGPYTLRDGDSMRLGAYEFVMRTLPDPGVTPGDKIATDILLDGVDFQQVDLRDALDALTLASAQRDPARKGLRFALDANPDVARVEAGTLMVRAPAPIYLNMVMRNVTLAEVVETIADATGLEAAYGDREVRFSRRR